MAERDIAEQLVEELVLEDGRPDLRPVHALGIGARGYFEAEPIAANYSVARHFQGGRTPVTVRFSNGSGSATRRDGWSDVRGMATRFHLDDGSATDLIAMTLPEFFSPTPDTFLQFAKDAKPARCHRESPWRKFLDLLHMTLPTPDPYPGQEKRPDEGAIRYADANKFAQLAVLDAATIGAPASYIRADYHAVHTFIVEAADGTRQYVRFSWQPIAGVLNTNPTEPPVDDYLSPDLEHRLAGDGTARFTLMMTIGETGDNFKDPTRPWPPHRKRVMVGTLTLVEPVPDQTEDCEKLSFNPWLLTEGITHSDDPVLRVRRDAYKYSSKRRGAVPCPFSGGDSDD